MNIKKTFGLVGYPLTHSFSKKYFTEKFSRENIDAQYELFELDRLDKLPDLFSKRELEGLNVTIPYKEKIIPLLNELDIVAKQTGAVNCIKITHEGGKTKTMGFNTDVYGFKQSLKPFLESKHERALILGTGGASKAVAHVLKEIGIDYLFVSRNPSGSNIISYDQLNDHIIQNHLIIINSTPLGMYPGIDRYPSLPYSALSSNHLLYDLIYNPDETPFLKKGKEKGATTLNGLSMLHLQAEKSWEIFNS